MDITKLREVIDRTAKLKAKEISLKTLSDCLKDLDEFVFPAHEVVPDILWKITCQYYSVLLQFFDECVQYKSNSVEKADLESLQDQTSFLATADLVRQFTIHLYLPRELRDVTKSEAQLQAIVEPKERIRRLTYCVAQFCELFKKKPFPLHPKMIDCAIDMIAGAYSLSVESVLPQMESIEIPKEIMLRGLLMIKGSKELAIELSKVIHQDLLQLIGEPGGFPILCRILLAVHVNDENAPAWHSSEVIAKIVTSRGHPKKFYRHVLADCFVTYQRAIHSKSADKLTFANTCVECIRRFYQLPAAYKELHERIDEYFLGRFNKFICPEELITGFVVAEKSKLQNDLYECQIAFTGSSFTSMPSSMLTAYLPLFLDLYSILPTLASERKYLQDMVIFCLANRSEFELKETVLSLVMEDLRRDEVDTVRFSLHPRLVAKQKDDDYTLLIGPKANNERLYNNNRLAGLVDMLTSANRNLLVYDVFIILLSELMTPVISTEKNVLLNETEQKDELCKRFYKKIVLIQPLSDLINHKHFHTQMYDNPDEILKVLEISLTHLIEEDTNKHNPGNKNEDILDIVLSILRDFLIRMRNLDKVRKVMELMQRFKSVVGCSDQLKRKIDYICNTSTVEKNKNLDSTCQTALSLCADPEPYCKVHGTTLLLKLLRERDVETIAQRHTILVLALENLRSEESYAFLNSVRLLVALSEVLESEIVEILLKEYHNVDNQLDYRLKIGEAAVKIVEVLGPIAVRYRDQLINCFLAGTCSTTEEFRTSSLSNIGNICRILSYQVHLFFYELFLKISQIIETDKYTPARRASILVLSQLIEGMPNLMDLQEYLLGVYHFLKHVIATDNDEITKIQAAVALDHLKTKTKDFFSIDPVDLERRMFGTTI